MLSILAYNVFLRPRFLFKDGQFGRANKISQIILNFQLDNNSDIDIIILSEMFDKKSRNLLLNGLKNIGFIYKTKLLGNKICSRKFPAIYNGGVIIVSKYPIIMNNEIIFNKSSGEDSISAKGCVYAKIKKGNFFYHIFGSHLQSGESNNINLENSKYLVRIEQFKEINNFITSLNIPKNEGIIFGGDINSNMKMNFTQNLLNIINTKIPTILNSFPESNNNTIDIHNDLNTRTNGSRENTFIDGIFIIKNNFHSLLKVQGIDSLKLLSDEDISLKKITCRLPLCNCLPCYDSSCKNNFFTRNLSDHYPVLCIINEI